MSTKNSWTSASAGLAVALLVVAVLMRNDVDDAATTADVDIMPGRVTEAYTDDGTTG